jgi:hypothetical protein
MAAYRSVGVPYQQAARWTYGELLAVYRGKHWRNGKKTRAPDIPVEEGLTYARKALTEIRRVDEEKV